MATLRAVVTIPVDSGLPEDQIVNRWHFNTSTSPSLQGDRDLIGASLATFYQSIDEIFSSWMGSPAVLTYYDLADPEPRAPIAGGTINLTPSISTGLPTEVALCLSFQAARASGQPQARRRNRVYLGPFSQSAQTGGTDGRPSFAARDLIRDAAQVLLDASDAAPTWAWVAWSDTDAVGRVVVDGWVDDAWDTQRRRGQAATQRLTFA